MQYIRLVARRHEKSECESLHTLWIVILDMLCTNIKPTDTVLQEMFQIWATYYSERYFGKNSG